MSEIRIVDVPGVVQAIAAETNETVNAAMLGGSMVKVSGSPLFSDAFSIRVKSRLEAKGFAVEQTYLEGDIMYIKIKKP